MERTPSVAFVGVLPPPIHGASSVNLRVFEEISKHAKVISYGNSFPKTSSKLSRPIFFFIRIFNIFVFFKDSIFDRPLSLYLSLSSKLGQVADLGYILTARLLKIRVCLHHHNFSYINENFCVTRLIFALAKDAVNVTLCDCMADKLSQRYALNNALTLSVSNAAFTSARPADSSLRGSYPQFSNENPLRIGFLSNITYQKGISEFIEVMKKLHAAGIHVQATVAGPITDSDPITIRENIEGAPNTVYLGPVYGECKERFFSQIHFLLFPTKYKNEAEPLTILEAFSNGVAVIAANRGCIGELVDDSTGAVFSNEKWVEQTVRLLASVSPTEVDLKSKSASKRFTKMQHCSRQNLAAMIKFILRT